MFTIITSGHFISSIHHIPDPYNQALRSGASCYQLEYCTTSGGEYSIDNKFYTRQYGSILFVKPKESFSNYMSVDPYQCYAVHFSCKDEDFTKTYLDNIPTYTFPQNTHEFEQKFQDIIVLAKDYMYSPNPPEIAKLKEELAVTKLKALILELYLDTTIQSGYTTSMYTKNIAEAQNFITANFICSFPINSS